MDIKIREIYNNYNQANNWNDEISKKIERKIMEEIAEVQQIMEWKEFEKYRDRIFAVSEIAKEFENLRKKKLTDKQVMDYIEILLPVEDGSTPQQVRNMKRLQEDMKLRYFDAPDLQDVGNNAYRFINAVSDFATHAQPLRKTANYKENLFARTVEGNPLIDKAYQMMCAA